MSPPRLPTTSSSLTLTARRLTRFLNHNHNVTKPQRRRHITTPSSPSPPPPPSSKPNQTPKSSSTPQSRLQSLLSRLPRPLRRYTTPLLNAPATHITSFLILHEITAIVPLFGLTALFHYTDWLPKTWMEGRYVREGVERFGKWFGRKGWFGFTPAAVSAATAGSESGELLNRQGGVEGVDVHGQVADGKRDDVDVERLEEEVEKRWNVSEEGGKFLVEVATAYALTKVFLPARIVLSVWGTPWFARVVLGRLSGLFGRGTKSVGHATTNITKAGK